MLIVDSMALVNNMQIMNEVENLECSKRVELTQSNRISYLVQRIKSCIRELFLKVEYPEREHEIARVHHQVETNLLELFKSIQIIRNATLIGLDLAEEDEKDGEIKEIIRIDSLKVMTIHFIKDIEKTLELLDAKRFEEADDFFEKHEEPLSRKMQDIINEIIENTEEEVTWSIRQLDTRVNRAIRHGIFFAVLSILLSLAIGVFIARSITNPLYKLIHGTKEIGKGNLEASVEFKAKGELQILGDSFNKMAKELKDRVESINKLNTELEGFNQTKDKCFSIIAHDLKNPFNQIMGFSSLLYKKYDEYNDTKRLRIIRNLDILSKTVYELLENLLTWTRLQRKKIEILPENLNLKEVVEKCLSSYFCNAQNKNISIVEKIPEEISIYADLFTLTVVINNIICNAVKFTPDEGTITILAKEYDDRVGLIISDTGIGMSQEVIDDLIQSEKSISSPGTRDEQGTGLGLILIKEFVAWNKGELVIESQPGKGTDFGILLPLSPV